MSLNIVSDDAKEQVLHDQVVQSIARSRFDIDGWSVSLGTETRALAPADITATSLGTVVAIGEVETCGSIDEKAAVRWKSLGISCPRFYLFVPEGTENRVVELLDMFEVVCAGLRCYAIDGDRVIVRSADCDMDSVMDDNHEWWVNLGRG